MERPPQAGDGKRSPAAGLDPEFSAKTTRRRFTPQYKLSIVERADACEPSGEIGQLRRREGLYPAAGSRTGVWPDWPTGIPAPAYTGTGFPTRFVSASSTRWMRCERERHDR